jgi:hypothetical protein
MQHLPDIVQVTVVEIHGHTDLFAVRAKFELSPFLDFTE